MPDQFWTNLPAIVSAVAAIVSAVFAVAIWLVYRGQWRTMREQAQYLQAQADTLTEQCKLLDATLHNAQAAERAWVTLDALFVHPTDKTAPIVVTLKNWGKTPAFLVDVRVVTWVRGTGQPWPPYSVNDYGTPADNLKRLVPPILAAGESVNIHLPNSIDDRSFANRKTNILCIYGYFEYRLLKDRTSTKVFRFARESDPDRSGDLGWVFQHIHNPGYNEAT